MNENNPSGPEFLPEDEKQASEQEQSTPRFSFSLRALWNRLVMLGLGESTLRIGTIVMAVVLVLAAAWVMGKYFLTSKPADELSLALTPTSQTTLLPITTAVPAAGSTTALLSNFGIHRLALLHTNLPSKPRTEITDYTVQQGDSIFAIAESFGLSPESIMWSNRYTIGGLPDNLSPGMVLMIPPEDGVIYEWQSGDGLNGVAKYYNVTADDIVNWAGNKLDPTKLGDWSLPNIPVGTKVFIPKGDGGSVDWLPQVSRNSPAISSSYGEGACGVITKGLMGTGSYIWPTTEKYLSGYDYSSIHHGIDIAGKMDNPIYAVDSGVVVYSGPNNSGYGNLLIIDHGNGWQSVYGHLDRILSVCGEDVVQGQEVALLGTTGNSTGPHLHFELRKDGGYVNPWDFLQK
jgi:LysM repeat protein